MKNRTRVTMRIHDKENYQEECDTIVDEFPYDQMDVEVNSDKDHETFALILEQESLTREQALWLLKNDYAWYTESLNQKGHIRQIPPSGTPQEITLGRGSVIVSLEQELNRRYGNGNFEYDTVWSLIVYDPKAEEFPQYYEVHYDLRLKISNGIWTVWHEEVENLMITLQFE